MGRTKSFFINTAVMTAGALLLRVINLAFRAWLFGRLGAQGVGEYQLLMTVFFLAVTVSTAGFGFAVTRVIAEGVGGRSSVRLLAAVSVGLAVLAGGVLWVLAPWLGRTLLGGAETVLPLRMLCLGLPLMALSATLRGFLVAVRAALLASVGELLELGSTIFLAVWLFGIAPPLVALCLSLTLGEAIACLYTGGCYLLLARRHRLPTQGRVGVGRLGRLLAPVLLGSVARSALSSAEHLLVPQGLQVFGGGQQAALASYGTVQGMVFPVLFLPLCILTSAAVLLVPELAQMNASGHRRSIENAAQKGIELTLWFSFLTAAVLLFFADAIGMHFFASADAGRYLRIMVPIIPILYLDSVVDGMLKGLDQQAWSFRYNLADGILRVAVAALLLPRLGLAGYLGLLFGSEIFNCALSLGRLVQVARVRIRPLWWFAAPLMAAATVYLLLRFCTSFCSGL